MPNKTVITLRLVIVTLLLLMQEHSFGQRWNVLTPAPDEDVILKGSHGEKLDVYIFIKKDSRRGAMIERSLTNILDNPIRKIDSTQEEVLDERFSFNFIIVEGSAICKPGKELRLSDINLEPYMAFKDYVILVHTRINLTGKSPTYYYKNVFEERNRTSYDTRFDSLQGVMFKPKLQGNTGDCPFDGYLEYSTLERLITSRRNIREVDEIKNLQEEIARQDAQLKTKNLEDSIQTHFRHNRISFMINPYSPIVQPLLVSSRELDYKGSYSTGADITYSNFKSSSTKMGLLLGLTWNMTRILTQQKPANLSDTLNWAAIDKDGDPYIRFAQSSDIKEVVSLNMIGITFGGVYKTSFALKTRRAEFSVRSQLDLNGVIEATFKPSAGTTSWFGYYPQYDTSRTLFDGEDGFEQDYSLVGVKKQNLNVKQNIIYWRGSFDFDFPLNDFQDLYLRLGCNMAISSGILQGNRDVSTGQLANRINQYNSLLYRNRQMAYWMIGVHLGITHAF